MSQEHIKLKYGISEWKEFSLNFWNIPKCGSTAVKAALLKKHSLSPTDVSQQLHSTDLATYITSDQARINGNLNFAVIRHPHDRVISMYKDFGLRRPVKGHKKKLLSSFDYFLDKVVVPSKDKTCNVHFRSASSYISPDGVVLVDRVLTLVTVKEFLYNRGIDFIKVNASPELEMQLSDEHKEKIKSRYAPDFILWANCAV
jgi:hypothetical protein